MHMIKIWTLLLLGVAQVHSQFSWDNLICDCGCVRTEFRAPCDQQFDNRQFNRFGEFTNPSCSVTQISDLPDCSTRTILCDTIWNCCNDNGNMKCTAVLQRVTTGKCRRYTCADTAGTCCYGVECTCSLPPTTPQMITTSTTMTTTKPFEEFELTPVIDIGTKQKTVTAPEDKDPTPPSNPEKTLTTSGDKNPAKEKPSKPNSGTTFHGIDRYLLILLFLMVTVITIQMY